MIEFYSKQRGFWSEPDNHVKVPHCSCNGCKCGGCKCNVRIRTVATFEAEKSYRFLLGLDMTSISKFGVRYLPWSLCHLWKTSLT